MERTFNTFSQITIDIYIYMTVHIESGDRNIMW